MTEADREVIRAKVRADSRNIVEGLAPAYLAKLCPILGRECEGPMCMLFLPLGEGNKITGGSCSIPLLASQAGPIADGLSRLAMVAATPQAPASKIIPIK